MIGLHHNGMHDFVLRELEVGARTALAEDDEACGFGPLFDARYLRWARSQPDHPEDAFDAHTP